MDWLSCPLCNDDDRDRVLWERRDFCKAAIAPRCTDSRPSSYFKMENYSVDDHRWVLLQTRPKEFKSGWYLIHSRNSNVSLIEFTSFQEFLTLLVCLRISNFQKILDLLMVYNENNFQKKKIGKFWELHLYRNNF